jgi:hypothetical protein
VHRLYRTACSGSGTRLQGNCQPAPPPPKTHKIRSSCAFCSRALDSAGSLTASTALPAYIHPRVLPCTAVYCRVLPAQEASVRGQLHMNTFRRLNLALVLQTGTTLVVAAQAVSLRNPLLTGASLESKRQNFPYCVPDCTAWYFRG